MDFNIINELLKHVQNTMQNCLRDTDLSQLLPNGTNILGNGKMLRSRLTLCIGSANGVNDQELIHAAAAVDIIHGASLLHDDVIDGGLLRRGAPAFWKEHSTNGAILLGDLLVFKAFNLLIDVGRSDLLEELIKMAANVCKSEVKQELQLRGSPGTWEECKAIARAKTGSLFAFAALAGADESAQQTDALREAGFLLGTAYQLADDLLDASGNETISGKTLGTDNERGKTTAVTATENAPEHPEELVYRLLDDAAGQLSRWPRLQQALNSFIAETLKPVLDSYLHSEQDCITGLK